MTAPADQPRRTQAERRAASEAALLRAAAELIAEAGIERTSLRSIGERAGISRAMPAYHFGSKEGLVSRLISHAYGRTFDATLLALGRAGDDAERLPKLDALRAIIDTFLEIVISGQSIEERAVVVMWGATFPTSSNVPAMTEADATTHQLLARLIREAQQEGSVRPGVDADAASLLVMGMARGVAALSLSHPDAADPARIRDLCGQAITAVLGNDASAGDGLAGAPGGTFRAGRRPAP
ncbi:TetR/AcrR family transcriptional regulator [Pseudofrankia inefficax]|uniref:Regulatory protein TetR n=1 Tax=Pseudofrankia inefficax (strain DSM 45817 / CECT 9037 / DDB 130130 / EuI1c) TaxID=298654 RepID=E3JBY0_PSEI1|nr:TetR/AcrR family transcriptional regulator [Pseudofrankia inefficax]ADP82290.1 regulatory protein TetR [Pseudofrankia inefficax]